MANYHEDIVNIELESGNIHRSFLHHSIGEGDDRANRFGVRLFRNGEPENVSGSCFGLFIRADGATVAINNGTVSGNVAYVTLPDTCYAVEGQFCLTIKVGTANDTITLRIVDGVVSRTSTNVAVDPGTIIPSIEDLIEEIEEAIAQIPADYSELTAEVSRISELTDTKAIINDLLEAETTRMLLVLDGSGETTTGKAWKKDKTETAGENYMYITYSIPENYIGNVAIVYGQGWGTSWPLVSFYDSSDNFISSAGERGNTEYKGLVVVIPSLASKMVVNGRTDSNYTVGVRFEALTDARKRFGFVAPYISMINSTLLEAIPSYSDPKNLPANCIFNLGASVYSSMVNLPAGLNTYATIAKLNGQGREIGGYSTYLCINEFSAWIGFENQTRIAWHLIYGQKNRQYLFIGDSYGDGYSHDGNNSGWCTYLADELGLSSSQYESRHQGGSGFANGGFLARLNSATGADFTDIVVLGGFNDNSATSADILSAIQTFCNRCKALYPEANIWIGCVGWIKEGTGSSAYSNWETIRGYITDKVLPAYQCAPKYGAKYLNMVEYLLTDDMMTPTDGYHPGETGNKAIAKGVKNGLMTGTVCLPFKSAWKG